MMLLGLLLASVALTAADYNRNHNRIVGGYETTIKDHPYQVSLQYLQKHLCGGSIVSDKFILTAAHCTTRNADLVGFSTRVGSPHADKNGSEYKFEKAFYFPTFSMDNFDCDVGVYVLKTPIVFGETVQPIKLVPEGQRPQHGEILTATGWGVTTVNIFDNKLAPVLRAVELPAVKLDLCRKAYSGGSKNITENMICAGGLKGKLIYRGDSGGPLSNTKKELVGIASWGRAFEPTGFPSVFTNVASPTVRQFIVGVMNGTIV